MPRRRNRRVGTKSIGERITLPDGGKAILFTQREFKTLRGPLPAESQIIHSGKKGFVMLERRQPGKVAEAKPGAKPVTRTKEWQRRKAVDLVERLRKTGWPELEIRLFLEQHGYPWPG